MKYLLDTCTVSDFVKGQTGVQTRIKATPPHLIAISTVTRMEIEFGMQLNPDRAKKLTSMMDAFLSSITILPFEDADAKAAGGLRSALQKQGQPIGAYDVLIAGCGLARGLVVVTSNASEFKRVSGLQVENWR
jgi:tRNA(fMet)-specific endonuclease VapC